MKSKTLLAGLLLTAGLATATVAMANESNSSLLVIREQGSFAAGGTVIPAREPYNPLKPQAAGQTLHGDHAYVFYQIPADARKYPLVFLHGAGQSAKTWETTPDGREGFQNIFLRRGFGVYLIDQPRRGDAGRSTVSATVEAKPDEQFWFGQFRLGIWPDFFEGTQFARGDESLNQFFRQMTPNTGPYDAEVISDAMTAVFDRIGSGILVTHSQGGGPGWLTAIKSKNVRAVVAYEPGSGFVFPEGELPKPIPNASSFGPFTAAEVPLEQFKAPDSDAHRHLLWRQYSRTPRFRTSSGLLACSHEHGKTLGGRREPAWRRRYRSASSQNRSTGKYPFPLFRSE